MLNKRKVSACLIHQKKPTNKICPELSLSKKGPCLLIEAPFSYAYFSPPLVSEWVNGLQYWMNGDIFTGMFSFLDVPKCSGIIHQVWGWGNNNISLRRVTPKYCWLVKTQGRVLAFFNLGVKTEICFWNRHKSWHCECQPSETQSIVSFDSEELGISV